MTQPPNKAQTVRSFRFLLFGIICRKQRKKETKTVAAAAKRVNTPLSITIKCYCFFLLASTCKKIHHAKSTMVETIFHTYLPCESLVKLQKRLI